MRKILLCLGLLALFPILALPDSLEITSGGASMSQSWHFDTCTSGPWQISCIIGGGYLMPSRLNGSTTLDFSHTISSPVALVMNFSYAPVGWNEDLQPTSSDPRIAEPCTMSGVWNGSSISGGGMLYCCTDGHSMIDVRLVFGSGSQLTRQVEGPTSAPEISSLALLGCGLVTLALPLLRTS